MNTFLSSPCVPNLYKILITNYINHRQMAETRHIRTKAVAVLVPEICKIVEIVEGSRKIG